MRKLSGLVVVFVTFGAARAAEDFDLRGPGPLKDAQYTTTGKLEVKGADAEMKRGAAVVKFKLGLTVTLEEDVKLLEVNGRDVKKLQTKLRRDRAETVGLAKGAAQIEPSVLEQEMIVSTLDGKAWKHTLAGGKPTEIQVKALAEFAGFASADALYPDEKVKVGHVWTADASGLDRLLGHTLTDVKGKLDRKFVKIEPLDGEQLAVVESTGKVSGKLKGNGDQPPSADVDVKHTAWKSLKTGLVVRESFTGTLAVTGRTKDGDVITELTIKGPISGESTTKVIEKK